MLRPIVQLKAVGSFRHNGRNILGLSLFSAGVVILDHWNCVRIGIIKYLLWGEIERTIEENTIHSWWRTILCRFLSTGGRRCQPWNIRTEREVQLDLFMERPTISFPVGSEQSLIQRIYCLLRRLRCHFIIPGFGIIYFNGLASALSSCQPLCNWQTWNGNGGESEGRSVLKDQAGLFT